MSARLLRFTTENYSPESRVHLWEGHNARALIPLDIRTLESAPMRSRQTNLHLPSIRMADVTGTSQIVERSEAFINDHPTGMIAVFFALEGEAFFFHR
ncbi:MAG TPA: AraC family transcriptional regulator, partial [Corynebacterium pollutisoli]|nr:AraC family transcriptional regulator [Corynebacterium pollutisoli]